MKRPWKHFTLSIRYQRLTGLIETYLGWAASWNSGRSKSPSKPSNALSTAERRQNLAAKHHGIYEIPPFAGNGVQNPCLTYFYHFIANKPPPGLLEFRSMQKKLPWNIIVLLGSGFALAEACKVRNSGAVWWEISLAVFLMCVQRLRVSLVRSILKFPVNPLGEGGGDIKPYGY